MERRVPTREEVLAYLREDRNWGRWGDDDQLGALNMLTNEKRVAAARLVQSGRAVSLSREFPKEPAANNPAPAQHFMRRNPREPGGGSAVDYYGISYHGQAATHLDALCHVWDENGMWNNRRRRTLSGSTAPIGVPSSIGRKASSPAACCWTCLDTGANPSSPWTIPSTAGSWKTSPGRKGSRLGTRRRHLRVRRPG